ncbi:MAG TPA: carboxymuconolactone decarboxylase family protein [Burkholderiaceae bacterium]|nr:carboxymuconolactone decarboxylase family protein [Burkholderiaceae bacterium]
MARIPYYDLAQAPDSYKELLGERPPLNLYRMLPHAGPAATGFLRLGGALLRRNELDSQLREIAILRVGMLSHAGYEVHQHKRVARQVGLSADKIAALTEADGDLGVFDERERFVLAFTDQLVHHVKADDAMFAKAQSLFNARQLSELVLTVGFYMMVSRFLENFEVDIEPPGTIE